MTRPVAAKVWVISSRGVPVERDKSEILATNGFRKLHKAEPIPHWATQAEANTEVLRLYREELHAAEVAAIQAKAAHNEAQRVLGLARLKVQRWERRGGKG